MFLRAVAAACVAAGCTLPAFAQKSRQPKPALPKPEAFEGEGAVEAVAPGRIQMVTAANQRCLVLMTPRTKVELSGVASADALRPGVCVRFTAAMDKQGVVKDKVGQLTIFTPSPETPLGFWSAAEGSSLIVGRVTGYHAATGRLQLTTGSAAIKAEVAADARVDANLADYTLARPGDRIAVKGETIPNSGLVQAASVKIAAVEPLAGGKPKPGRPPKEPRTPKKNLP